MRRYLFEFFFFSDIFVMSLVCVCGLGLTLAWANSLVTVAVFLGGVALYAHRFLFHLPPPKHPFLLKLLKRLHYDHHEDPDKLELLFLPLWYSVPQFVLVGSIVYLVTGKIAITTTFLSGAVLYHLYYEWKHYIAHRPIKPLTPWGEEIEKISFVAPFQERALLVWRDQSGHGSPFSDFSR